MSKNIHIKIYSALFLLAVLYGCAASYFTLREEHRPRAFANGVLGLIFGTRDKNCRYSRHEGRWGSVGIAPLIFNFGTRWASGLDLRPGALPQVYNFWFPLNKRLVGPRTGQDHSEGNSLASVGNRTTIPRLSRP